MLENIARPHPGHGCLPPSLRESLAAVFGSGLQTLGDSSVGALRDAVCRYVDAARRRGDPVQRVIVKVKQELHEAGLIDRHVTADERALGEAVVRWSIERFYSPADLPRANDD